MRRISCGDDIIDEEDFFASYAFSILLDKGKFSSNRCPLFSGAPRLMAREEFLPKRRDYYDILWSEIINEYPGMIRSSENPITETDWWVDYDIWSIAELLFHTAK